MNPSDANKIHKMSLPDYYQDMMTSRESNKSGYINLPKSNFKKMVDKIETASDVEVLKTAHVNFIGHRN